MRDIRPGDMVTKVSRPELDPRPVVTVGFDFITLNIMGQESPPVPLDDYVLDYREPEMVTTVEDLGDLPIGTLLHDGEGQPVMLVKGTFTPVDMVWPLSGMRSSVKYAANYLPLTLTWKPEESA